MLGFTEEEIGVVHDLIMARLFSAPLQFFERNAQGSAERFWPRYVET